MILVGDMDTRKNPLESLVTENKKIEVQQWHEKIACQLKGIVVPTCKLKKAVKCVNLPQKRMTNKYILLSICH